MPLPYQGNANGNRYLGHPTLVPNFYPEVVGKTGFIDQQSPAQYNANNPRANASNVVTIGGTITNGDTIQLTLSQAQLPNGAISFTYTALTGQTIQDVAEGLASGLNQAIATAGISNILVVTGSTSTASEATLSVLWSGQAGNAATLTKTLSGGATETVTFNPTNGKLTGGTGPVYAVNNFSFSYKNVTLTAWAGRPFTNDPVLIAALVAQNMPVV